MRNILFFFTIVLSACSMPDMYNIRDFGAKSGGKILSTEAIQKAIDKCNRDGGGTVYIPAGTFLTGTIVLKSYVNLHFETGATLLGCAEKTAYQVQGENRGIIFADDACNVSITGFGEIQGMGSSYHISDTPHVSNDFDRKYIRQGDKYMDGSDGFPDGPIKHNWRPGMMCVILRSNNVHISDVTFRDSPEWTIRIGDCDGVNIQGIKVLNNPLIPNNDGIHCTHSRNIHISDCHIEAGDDGIIVTGFPYGIEVDGSDRKKVAEATYGNKTRWAENVTVTNCTMSSRSAGIRIGYGMYPIRNCIFDNIVIYNSNRGIGIFSRDTGSIENILFSNITIATRLHSGHWWGKGEPIHISAIQEDKRYKAGAIRNIRFTNIISESETGAIVYGADTSIVEGIVFDNVKMTIRNSNIADSYGGNIDLRPAVNPQNQIFSHDIPGIYLYRANDVLIRNTQVVWRDSMASYFTSAITAEKSENIIIDQFRGEPAKGTTGHKAIDMIESKKVVIR